MEFASVGLAAILAGDVRGTVYPRRCWEALVVWCGEAFVTMIASEVDLVASSCNQG